VNEADVAAIKRGLAEISAKVVPLAIFTVAVNGLNKNVSDTVTNLPLSEGFKNGVSEGTCRTTKPGGCMSKKFDESNGKIDRNGKGIDELNAALNAADLQLLGVVNQKLGPQVKGGISGKLGEVFDKVKDVADKSWNALGLDRVINLLTLVTTLHNAAQLSRDLGETLVDTASTVVRAAQAVIPGFLKRPDGENMEIDIGAILKSQLQAFLIDKLGSDEYYKLKAGWMKANRILTATSNALSAIRGMNSAVTEGLEAVGGCVSQGFNGIQREGLVSDKTWPWMNENPNFKHRGLTRFTNYLENAEDATSSIQQIAQAPIEFVEEAKELVEAATEFKKANNESIEKVAEAEKKKDAESEAAEVADDDLLPGS
jgi:hypothetical protein